MTILIGILGIIMGTAMAKSILYRLQFLFLYVRSSIIMSESIDRVAIKWKGICHTAEPPRRHHDVIREMAKRNFGPECMHNQGFMTDRGRFVDRKEALEIATKANQIKIKTSPKDKLFSEDLW